MRIRFFNARILTLCDGFNIINGELWTEDNIISYVGPEKNQDNDFDQEIDVKKNLIMPGFKDAHTHSAMTFLRSFADDLPLNEWLNNKVFPMEAKLTEEYMYYFSKIAIMEYLSSGITSNFDMYLNPAPIAKASVECGYRTVICSGLNDFTSSIGEIEEFYNQYNNYDDLISYSLGFHAEYTSSKGLLVKLAELSNKYKDGVYAHNSETRKEVNECINRYGLTPTQLFESIGLLNYGGGGYHCIYFSDEDIDIFKKRNLSIVTNPASNCKLASGIAPVAKYIDSGINLAIGTDGAASNNCLDMFREMFLVSALSKIYTEDASSVDANQVLNMATVGGAIAMGLDKSKYLAVEQYADLIIIDLNMPNMQPINNISKNIVYSGSKINVKLTMVNGKILYCDGYYFINCDPNEIYRKCSEIKEQILLK